MTAFLYKNYCFYKHNFSEFLMLILNSLIQIFPIVFMLSADSMDSESFSFIVVSFLTACLIVDVVVGICFEYYKEVIKGTNMDLMLIRSGPVKFVFAQSLFYLFVNVLVLACDILILVAFKPFNVIGCLSIQSFLCYMVLNIFFLISVCGLGRVLAYIVNKTRIFSMSSMFCSLMLFFSNCYMPMEMFPKWSHFLFFVNPFYYYTIGIQHLFFNVNLPVSFQKLVFADFVNAVLVFVCPILIINLYKRNRLSKTYA